jgi:hypothetical protein
VHEVKQIDFSGALVDVLMAATMLITYSSPAPWRPAAGRIAFNPESLPASEREAIREGRMGVFNKIFLKFAAVF